MLIILPSSQHFSKLLPFLSFHHLGLEYFIEIQHNTIKKMVPDYCCLLCDVNIKKGSKDKKSILEVARNHLKSSAHKMKFLVSDYSTDSESSSL